MGDDDAALEIGSITLDFDSAATSYQFKGDANIAGGDLADVDLGTGGRLTILGTGVLTLGDEGLPED